VAVRSCRVTIQDMDGVSVAGIAQGLNVVKVSVADVRVKHEARYWHAETKSKNHTWSTLPRLIS
jgi:hypothetical protein